MQGTSRSSTINARGLELNSAVLDVDFESWNIGNGHKSWPAPENGFHGRKMEVFWDLDNVALNNEWPIQGNKPDRLTAQQHYDLIISVFGNQCGVAMRDFHLHPGVAETTLHHKSMPPTVRKNICMRHSPNVSLVTAAGKKLMGANGTQQPLKEDEHGLDVHLIDVMDKYMTSRARPGDVLVLISGDGGYLPALRKARQDYHLQVLHMYSKEKVAKEYMNNQLISWQCEWSMFLAKHRDTYGVMRPSDKEEAMRVLASVAESAKSQKAIGNVNMAILIDATSSMDDVIGVVKDTLKTQLMESLFKRYPRLYNRTFFSIVAYRDIGDSEPLEVFPQDGSFTNNVSEVRTFLAKLKAYGGGDYPEDVAGAVMKVASLKWDTKGTNLVLHFFDDPGHGRQFNATFLNDINGADDFLDAPPPNRRDPGQEIRESIKKLKQDCGVTKYYALTINRRGLKTAPTAKTVQEMQAIAKAIPLPQGRLAAETELHEEWLDEVPLVMKITNVEGDSPNSPKVPKATIDAADLVRKMLRSSTRTLSAVTSMSRISSLRSFLHTMTERIVPMKTVAEEMEATEEEAEVMNNRNVATEVMLSPPTAPLTPGKAAINGPNIIVRGSFYYQWPQTHGSKSFKTAQARLKTVPTSQVYIKKMLDEPYSMEDLLERVDGHLALDSCIPAVPKKNCKIKDDTCFASGVERLAYLGAELPHFDLKVFKEFKHTGQEVNSIRRYEQLLTSHMVATFLAKEFNKVLADTCKAPVTLKYVDAVVVSCQKAESDPPRHRFAETFYLGRFKKYTNNCGFVAAPKDFLPACDAFAHWCYWATGGRVMATDLQGWYNEEEKIVFLTDPCVHCIRPGFVDDPNKDGNLAGFEDYFASHQCDATCHELKLDVVAPTVDILAKIRAKAVKKVEPLDPNKGASAPTVTMVEVAADMHGPARREAAINDGCAYVTYMASVMKANGMSNSDDEEGGDGPATPEKSESPAVAEAKNASAGGGGGKKPSGSKLGSGSGNKASGSGSKTKVCHLWKRGYCYFGERCKFQHPNGKNKRG